MAGALYIENEPYPAQWLRNLIEAGAIAPGEVYEGDIRDIRPARLAGYTQVHAFAGIGVWSYALRLAGWGDERPVWTVSCPCQPFSAAGRRDGIADERHLWPHFFHLLENGKGRDIPVLGEQVASQDGLAWFDLVCADLAYAAHACWADDICAASVGAPNVRQRLYFLAVGVEKLFADSAVRFSDAARRGWGMFGGAAEPANLRHPDGGDAEPDGGMGDRPLGGRRRGAGLCDRGEGKLGREIASDYGATRGLDDTAGARPERAEPYPEGAARAQGRVRLSGPGRGTRGLDDADGGDAGAERLQRGREHGFEPPHRGADRGRGLPGPVNGFWRASDWLGCRDGRWRPVEAGTFPLVDGADFRLGSGSAHEGRNRAQMLRGYGNALNAEQARLFIETVMEVLDG